MLYIFHCLVDNLVWMDRPLIRDCNDGVGTLALILQMKSFTFLYYVGNLVHQGPCEVGRKAADNYISNGRGHKEASDEANCVGAQSTPASLPN